MKQTGKWLVWDGTHWVEDDLESVHQKARLITLATFKQATAMCDAGVRLARHAYTTQQIRGRKAMLELAQVEPKIAVHVSTLDADPFVLNVLNGTVDLHTGSLKPPDPTDLLIKRAAVEYDPDATCPTWIAFLDRITASGLDLIRYLQKIVGHLLTGDVSEQAIFFFHGLRANGKTTFIETIAKLLNTVRGSGSSKNSPYPGHIDRECRFARSP